MQWEELASVSGKGGLFVVVKAGKGSILMESLDEKRAKLVAGPSAKVSMLAEIALYTRTKEGTIPLRDVMKKIKSEFGSDTGIDADSDPNELKAFLKSFLPDYDEDRVYVSDIKKLLKWYEQILKYAPGVLIESADPATKSS